MKQRGFEVLEEFKEKVVTIMENDPETYGIDPSDGNWLPRRATEGSAGYDLRALESVSLAPGECKVVGTGLTAYMEKDEELQIRSRSGNALKLQLVVLNSPGTIDSDYYGKHIGVILMNLGEDCLHIEEGDRVAQAVFSKYLIVDNDSPISSNRDGGFGSTGSK